MPRLPRFHAAARASGVLLSLLLMGAGPPSFRGCSESRDDPPDPPTPLPVVDAGRCFSDDQCPADGCTLVRCLAGSCVPVGPVTDADGDNHAPAPCGDDCNDSDFTIFGGAPEACDGADNDCDGSIDEGAPLVQETYPLGAGDPTSLVLPWAGDLLITELNVDALFGLPLTVDGEVGTPLELLRPAMGTGFSHVAAAAASDGTVAFVAVDDLGEGTWIVLDPVAGAEPAVVSGPSSFTTGGGIVQIEATAHESGFAFAYDDTGSSGRIVYPTLTAPAPVVLPGPGASFGLASDGTHVVVADALSTIYFLQSDGSLRTMHVAPFRLEATRTLASSAGSVVVLSRDSFDHRVGRVSSVGGVGETFPAPSGTATDQVRIMSAGELVIVSRTGTVSTAVSALQPDLQTFEGRGFTLGRSDAPVTRVSAAEADDAIGVLGALASGGVELGIIRACVP